MAQRTLDQMVIDLRAEIGHSLVSGQGTNMTDTLKHYLRRQQRELYMIHDWPQFIIDESVAFNAGDRYVTFSEIDEEQINHVWCRQGPEWYRVGYGIDPEDYSRYNSDDDVRGFPVQRYRLDPRVAGVEIWPIPDIAGTLVARGQLQLTPLVDGADTSMLDADLIVLFAAAHFLARQRDEDAPVMLQKANQYLTNVKRNYGGDKRAPRSMAYASGGRRPRPGLDFIPRSS